MTIIEILASEFKLAVKQVENAVKLMDDGNTVPFIARYRKEETGGIDDVVLTDLAKRLEYLRGLDKRRAEIIKALTDLSVISYELTQAIENASTLSELEDIYRPYRPKRRTRAIIAKEKGLEPLAMWILMEYPKGDLVAKANEFVTDDISFDDALAGARDIIAELIGDNADARKRLRESMQREAVIKTCAAKEEDSVYSMYYDYSEPVNRMAPHRILAVNRGEKEEYLKVSIDYDSEKAVRILNLMYVKNNSSSAEQVKLAAEDAWSRLIFPSLEREIRNDLTDRANVQAIKVFSENLRNLLMQRPVKGKVTLGVDPGYAHGCKLAVVDENGRVLDTGVGYFTIPGQERRKAEAAQMIKRMCRQHHVSAIAIGNGTASRESEQFIVSLLPELDGAKYMIVSEAGASVYSAGKIAQQEFPDYDVMQRSAISIARRMQDPLSELVKIEPKAIGVGQYQHDLKQSELESALDSVVESCVNSVGVEISTASVPLLEHVAGVGHQLAVNIVDYRDQNGISSRAELKKVPKLGPRAFEQCAGFIRVAASKNPLDATAVHPESYEIAKAVLNALNLHPEKGGIPGIQQQAEEYGLEKMCSEFGCGLPTLKDILSELAKPGRDPRDSLPEPILRSDVLSMEDLKPGMELTGTVRNVIDFGAFVDIGVHQDGLVHISRITNKFIKHPSEILSVGDIVKVWVVDVDIKKHRIGLTMLKPVTKQ